MAKKVEKLVRTAMLQYITVALWPYRGDILSQDLRGGLARAETSNDPLMQATLDFAGAIANTMLEPQNTLFQESYNRTKGVLQKRIDALLKTPLSEKGKSFQLMSEILAAAEENSQTRALLSMRLDDPGFLDKVAETIKSRVGTEIEEGKFVKKNGASRARRGSMSGDKWKNFLESARFVAIMSAGQIFDQISEAAGQLPFTQTATYKSAEETFNSEDPALAAFCAFGEAVITDAMKPSGEAKINLTKNRKIVREIIENAASSQDMRYRNIHKMMDIVEQNIRDIQKVLKKAERKSGEDGKT